MILSHPKACEEKSHGKRTNKVLKIKRTNEEHTRTFLHILIAEKYALRLGIQGAGAVHNMTKRSKIKRFTVKGLVTRQINPLV